MIDPQSELADLASESIRRLCWDHVNQEKTFSNWPIDLIWIVIDYLCADYGRFLKVGSFLEFRCSNEDNPIKFVWYVGLVLSVQNDGRCVIERIEPDLDDSFSCICYILNPAESALRLAAPNTHLSLICFTRCSGISVDTVYQSIETHMGGHEHI